MNRLPIVLIVWKDHCGSGSWENYDPHHSYTYKICKTVGWLVKKDDEIITVAGSLGMDDSCREIESTADRMNILRNCVIEYKILRKS